MFPAATKKGTAAQNELFRERCGVRVSRPDGCSSIRSGKYRLREDLLNVDDTAVEVGCRPFPMQLEPACRDVDELKASSVFVAPDLRRRVLDVHVRGERWMLDHSARGPDGKSATAVPH